MDENLEAHKIMEMEETKRGKVINAAMAEFRNGYAKASTDAIVREAGISKGLLFHYFGTKEKLYEFLLAYSMDVIMNEYYSLVNFDEPDLLERLWQMLLLKMELSYKHPAIFDFIGAAYAQEGARLNAFTDRFAREGSDPQALLMRDIDTSLFKEEFNAEKIVNIMRWAVVGYSNSQITADKTLDDYKSEFEGYLNEIEEYFKIFRKAFYR